MKNKKNGNNPYKLLPCWTAWSLEKACALEWDCLNSNLTLLTDIREIT